MRSIVRAVAVGLAALLASTGLGADVAGADAASTVGRHTDVVTAQVVGRLAANDCCNVTVPWNYVYNPSMWHPSWHDYCTSSPDEFAPLFGAHANFRGPCARHDMCIQYHQLSRRDCDDVLFAQLFLQCAYTYGSSDPRRYACQTAAAAYYTAVRASTYWPW